MNEQTKTPRTDCFVMQMIMQDADARDCEKLADFARQLETELDEVMDAKEELVGRCVQSMHENDQLRKDKDRLDWLETHISPDFSDTHFKKIHFGMRSEDSLRTAIDAAMKGTTK